jgi:hypothetical protein
MESNAARLANSQGHVSLPRIRYNQKERTGIDVTADNKGQMFFDAHG